MRLYQAAADGLPASFPPVRGDAALAQAAEAAIARPFWRGRRLVLAGVVALAGMFALAAALVLRGGSGGGLDAIQANHVGLIDPQTNEIVAEIPVGIRPGPVAVGADSVWVGNLQDRTLTKIDPGQRTATGTIPLGSRTPTGIAVGLGAVWVAHGLRGQVSRIDPQFGQVTRSITVGGTAFGSPNGSVALDARSVWVVFGDSTFAHLDAAGRVLGQTLAGSQPAGVVVAGSSVWVTNSGDATVQRFNRETFRQEPLQTFNVSSRPSGIIYADGAIWVANAGGAVVTRIDPASGATLPISVGEGASALTSGSGAVWVANTAARTISRIDPTTNDVVATIEIGNAPSGIAAANGFLWVTAQAP